MPTPAENLRDALQAVGYQRAAKAVQESINIDADCSAEIETVASTWADLAVSYVPDALKQQEKQKRKVDYYLIIVNLLALAET